MTELTNPTGESPGVVAAGPRIHAALAELVRRAGRHGSAEGGMLDSFGETPE